MKGRIVALKTELLSWIETGPNASAGYSQTFSGRIPNVLKHFLSKFLPDNLLQGNFMHLEKPPSVDNNLNVQNLFSNPAGSAPGRMRPGAGPHGAS